MSPVAVVFVAVGAVLLGFGAGGVVSCLVRRRRLPSPHEGSSGVRGGERDREIEAAAWRWAVARGLPGAAPLVADKLRLIAAVRSRPGRRRLRRRWWR